MSARVKPAYLAGFVAFVVTAFVSHLRPTPYNNFVLLAQALLNGHTWIDWPGNYIDALPYHGHYFVIEAPLPALLLLPFVALAGLHANQTVLGAVLAAVAVGAAWELGERLRLRRAGIAWICAFFLAGTDLLWCAMLGDVWMLAHVSAACFTMLALVELAGKRRSWLVALLAACAFESRFSMIAALPAYAYLLAAWHPEPLDDAPDGLRRRTTSLAVFCAVLVPVAILWVLYNQARWGTWNDIGYTAWYHQDQAGMPTGSPFRLAYLPYQLQSFFVQLPTFLPSFPWLRPEYSGVALTWTSPALLLAFLARAPLRWVLVLGRDDPGRDTEPALLRQRLRPVRDATRAGLRTISHRAHDAGRTRASAGVGESLIAYSVAAGLWGCWYWLNFLRT